MSIVECDTKTETNADITNTTLNSLGFGMSTSGKGIFFRCSLIEFVA